MTNQFIKDGNVVTEYDNVVISEELGLAKMLINNELGNYTEEIKAQLNK